MANDDSALNGQPLLAVPSGRDASLDSWTSLAEQICPVDPALYVEYDVKRGLRDQTGKGVLAGLTQIGDVVGTAIRGRPARARARAALLPRHRGHRPRTTASSQAGQHGFEESAYLLLFGTLPTKEQLAEFETYLADMRRMPRSFVHDGILRMPSRDVMNAMMRGVLGLYTLDPQGSDISIRNVLRQSLHLIAKLPMLAVYAYQTYLDEFHDKSLVIHRPEPEYSTAENFLHMLRPNSEFTELEALVLDMMLVLHAEHGGGNNSTFATHVVSSTGTDTYSSIAASLGSLKGPRHGGANLKVVQMFDGAAERTSPTGRTTSRSPTTCTASSTKRRSTRPASCTAWATRSTRSPIRAPSSCAATPRSSPPRRASPRSSSCTTRVERIAPLIVSARRRVYKGVSANVDFYSGFVYKMLEIPPSSTRRSSRSRASWAGAHTGSRSSPAAASSSARATRASPPSSATRLSSSANPPGVVAWRRSSTRTKALPASPATRRPDTKGPPGSHAVVGHVHAYQAMRPHTPKLTAMRKLS